MVKEVIRNKPVDKLPPNTVFGMTNDLVELFRAFHSKEAENVGQILDNTWDVLDAGAKLTKTLLRDYAGDIEV